MFKKINNRIEFSYQSILIRTNRKDVMINVDDIVFLKKQKNYVIYHTISKDYKVRSDINTEFEKLSFYGFIRPHIGYIVNNTAVVYIATDHILLNNDIRVPLNKKHRDEIKQVYFKWLGDKDV